jgi:hypothetical protein
LGLGAAWFGEARLLFRVELGVELGGVARESLSGSANRAAVRLGGGWLGWEKDSWDEQAVRLRPREPIIIMVKTKVIAKRAQEDAQPKDD